ncbi:MULTISPECIES: element excision factor XisH family protein [unclassified Spirosoma]|uniref:element excision factor XisH family protein n=1 Tax=unclassified Spirosoma TaxID=2621999 RepID=UPI000963E58F|nr:MULTISPECIES: element excision factor XisH family protein [unclassified Spirosoma]MBN8821646.1 XisH family protein [Spirosoma sp.]OJW80857.1 MAG: fatty-acid oxidation protein subunit alpha [Spirosoma sp. 48-14]
MARDLFHELVREALEADGWIITHDPFVLKSGGLRLEVDLAAEQMLAAELGHEKIVVEIKSFIGKSKLNDFYEAKGQYDVYRRGLKKEGVQRKLYLAVDVDVYETFFQKSLIAELLEDELISLLVYDIPMKRIVQWITR